MAISSINDLFVSRLGLQYKDEQIVSWSHYYDPIDTSNGRSEFFLPIPVRLLENF